MNPFKRWMRWRGTDQRKEDDRRCDPRAATRVPAEIELGDGARGRAMLLDVSRQGAQLSLDGAEVPAASPGGELRLQVFNPFAAVDDEANIEAVGRVTYRRELPSGETRVGVRFEGAAADGSAVLLAAPPEWEAQIQRLVEQIHLDLPGERCRAVVLTSAVPGEGVTTIARWLATTLARKPSTRVLYVDADFAARGRGGAGGEAARGLIHLAREGIEPDAVLVRSPLANLDILLSGKPDADALVNLPEGGLQRAMQALRARYDFVIVDAAATTVSPFTFVLARNADGVFLVVSIGAAAREAVTQAVEQVGRYGGKLLGVVANHARTR